MRIDKLARCTERQNSADHNKTTKTQTSLLSELFILFNSRSYQPNKRKLKLFEVKNKEK